jgi:hypothetical protein
MDPAEKILPGSENATTAPAPTVPTAAAAGAPTTPNAGVGGTVEGLVDKVVAQHTPPLVQDSREKGPQGRYIKVGYV